MPMPVEPALSWAFFIVWTGLAVLTGAILREFGRDIYRYIKEKINLRQEGYRYNKVDLEEETEDFISELDDFVSERRYGRPGMMEFSERANYEQTTDDLFREEFYKRAQALQNEFDARNIEVELGVGEGSLDHCLSRDQFKVSNIAIIKKRFQDLNQRLKFGSINGFEGERDPRA